MEKTAFIALQTAVYQRLAYDGPLSERINGVYDHVNTGTERPYVTVGEPVTNPWNTKVTYGENATIVIQVHSGYQGNYEVGQILNLILGALTKNKLTLDDEFSMAKFKRESANILKEPDNNGRRGILNVRAFIMQK